MKIEVVGYWIYCFKSFQYRNQLKDMSFWFSIKHKAWIFSGGKKIAKRRTRLSLDRIKEIHGFEFIRDQIEEKETQVSYLEL